MTETIKRPHARMAVEDRREAILRAAVRVVERRGFTDLVMDEVAKEAGCTRPLVIKRLGRIAEFRRTVIDHGIATGNLKVIGHGLVLQDRRCRRLPDDVKEKALLALGSLA